MKKYALLLPVLLTSSFAFAEPSKYVGVNWVKVDTDTCENHDDKISCKDEPTGYKLYAGKNLSPSSAVEVFYSHLGTLAEVDYADGSSADMEASTMGVNYVLKGGSGKLGYFGKVGLNYSTVELKVKGGPVTGTKDHNGWNGTLGIGAEYKVNPKMSIVAEYDRYGELGDEETKKAGANSLGLGVKVNF